MPKHRQGQERFGQIDDCVLPSLLLSWNALPAEHDFYGKAHLAFAVYLPLKTGARFSKKARVPSRTS